MTEGWRCTYTEGAERRCPEPVSLVGPVEGLCYYHGRLKVGGYGCPAKGCALARGHRGDCSPVTARARGLFPDDAQSDEGHELWEALRALGG